MLKVGLTGGIGSGKTYISEIFKRLNIPIYNADIQAKYLMNNSVQLIHQIKELFGNQSYIHGELNRKHISNLVFKDRDLLKRLNAIVHPAVNDDFTVWCQSQEQKPYILKEAAILFESNSHKDLYKTILVTAPDNVRIKRVCERDNCSPEEVTSRINNQWATEKLAALADFIINNDDKQLILPQIIKIDSKLKNKWENLGNG